MLGLTGTIYKNISSKKISLGTLVHQSVNSQL